MHLHVRVNKWITVIRSENAIMQLYLILLYLIMLWYLLKLRIYEYGTYEYINVTCALKEYGIQNKLSSSVEAVTSVMMSSSLSTWVSFVISWCIWCVFDFWRSLVAACSLLWEFEATATVLAARPPSAPMVEPSASKSTPSLRFCDTRIILPTWRGKTMQRRMRPIVGKTEYARSSVR